MTDAISKVLADMQLELAKALLAKVRSGEATAADLNVARQLLKDNSITSVPTPGDPMDNLVHALPFTGDEDEDVPTYRN